MVQVSPGGYNNGINVCILLTRCLKDKFLTDQVSCKSCPNTSIWTSLIHIDTTYFMNMF